MSKTLLQRSMFLSVLERRQTAAAVSSVNIRFLLVASAPMNINSSFIRRHALLHSTIFNYWVYFGLNSLKIDNKYDLFTGNLFTI